MYDIAVLAGGKATRLGKMTENIPKSLIDINGRPFIYHQLKLLEKNGFKHVVLCLGKFGELIEDYLETFDLAMDVDFSYDGYELLGTGGAIKNALPSLGDNFFVLYGDSYLPIKYKKIENYYSMKSEVGLMTIYKNTNSLHKNNVAVDNNQIIAYDKNECNHNMQYIDYGLGIFNKEVFYSTQLRSFDLSEVYKHLIKYNQLLAYEIKQQFYEVGSLEGIEEFRKYIEEKDGIY